MNFNFDNSNWVHNEIRKMGLLITEADRLGLDLSLSGESDVNPHTGNVYIWFEDLPFSLYIGLGSDTIYVLYTHYETGDEEERAVTLEDNVDTLAAWCIECERALENE
jgi:hypothetical protein